MFRTAGERFAGFDILCNNAGIVCGDPLWPATDPHLLETQVMINLGAVILGTRLAVDPLGARGGGVVVNIFHVPPTELPRTQSVLTLVGGKVVFDAGAIKQ